MRAGGKADVGPGSTKPVALGRADESADQARGAAGQDQLADGLVRSGRVGAIPPPPRHRIDDEKPVALAEKRTQHEPSPVAGDEHRDAVRAIRRGRGCRCHSRALKHQSDLSLDCYYHHSGSDAL